MRVVLFEFIDEVKKCLDEKGKTFLASRDTCVVSLAPKVESYLKSRNISCQNTIPYFSNQSHTAVMAKTEHIVRRIDQCMTLEDTLGMKNTYHHFFIHHLRFYLHYFFMNLEVLNNITQKYKVSEVYYYANGECIASKAYIDSVERLLAPVVQQFCQKRSILAHEERLKAPEKHKTWPGLKVQSISLLSRAYFRLYFALLKRYLKSAKLSSPVVMIPTWGYKFKDLMAQLRLRYPKLRCVLVVEGEGSYKQKIILFLVSLARFFPFLKKIYIADYVIPVDYLSEYFPKQNESFLAQTLIQIENFLEKDLKDELTYHGVDIREILLRKIREGFAPELLQLSHKIFVLRELLKEFKPKLILSPFSTGFYYALGELSQLLNIESCVITHGSHVPPQNQYEEIENYWLGRGVVLNEYKTVAVQTPWLEKFLDHYNDKRSRLVTGPLVFAQRNCRNGTATRRKKSLKLPSGKKIFLYATTQKARHCHRFYITETPDEFVDSLKEIVAAVHQSENSFLIVRPHPVCDLNVQDFKALLPKSDKFMVIPDGKFENLLSVADCLISYSSTCIEEALANGIPVVLYDKWCRYKHFPLEEMPGEWQIKNSPVTYITNVDKLKRYLAVFSSQKEVNFLEEDALRLYQYSLENNRRFYDYAESFLNGGKVR